MLKSPYKPIRRYILAHTGKREIPEHYKNIISVRLSFVSEVRNQGGSHQDRRI
jgi:hypothetical protein